MHPPYFAATSTPALQVYEKHPLPAERPAPDDDQAYVRQPERTCLPAQHAQAAENLASCRCLASPRGALERAWLRE